MWKLAMVAALALLCAACGGGIDSYEDAAAAQMDIMREMIDVLEGVDDDASAEKAAGKIEALGGRMQDIAEQLSKLPAPSRDEMQRIARMQSEVQAEFQQKAMAQMMKMAQYPVLAEAWSNAMMTVN